MEGIIHLTTHEIESLHSHRKNELSTVHLSLVVGLTRHRLEETITHALVRLTLAPPARAGEPHSARVIPKAERVGGQVCTALI